MVFINFSHLVDGTPSKSQRPPNTNLMPDIRSPLLNSCPGLSKIFPKCTAYRYCHWLPQEVEGKSLLLKTLCTSETGSRTWTDLNTPSLKSSSYGTRRYHTSLQIREVIKSPTHLWYLLITPMTDHLGMTSFQVQYGTHTLVVTSGLIGLNCT